ncbi:MAG: hypothetical protein M3P06_16405, partial [Acidobacteriota bacterium]|nr:hypothetical protein [Acidobacteriota bacterium]
MKISLKAALTVPAVFAGLLTVMTWQAITMVYVAPVPVQPFESVAVTVIGKEPVCVGVPESTPFAANVKPAGSVPVANVNVALPIAPVCVKVSLNALEAVPFPLAGLLTVMTWQAMTSV